MQLRRDVSGAHEDTKFRANLISRILRTEYGPPSENIILH